MKAIRNIANNLGKYRKKVSVDANSPIVQALCLEGERIIAEAEETRHTENKLYNQHDAYGYAVYYNGKLIPGTMGFLEEEKSTKVWKDSKMHGREHIIDMLTNYDAPKRGITLVVGNAMPYSVWQERGLVPGVNRILRIMSQITGELDDLAQRYKGRLTYNW